MVCVGRVLPEPLLGTRTLLVSSSTLRELRFRAVAQSRHWQYIASEVPPRRSCAVSAKSDGVEHPFSDNGTNQTQDNKEAAQRNAGNAALWPVRFLLQRIRAQQPSRSAKASAVPTNMRPAPLQRGGRTTGSSGNGAQPRASSGEMEPAPDGTPAPVSNADGTSAPVKDGRSMEQLREAADWQMQRAYAMLRDKSFSEHTRIARLEAGRPSPPEQGEQLGAAAAADSRGFRGVPAQQPPATGDPPLPNGLSSKPPAAASVPGEEAAQLNGPPQTGANGKLGSAQQLATGRSSSSSEASEKLSLRGRLGSLGAAGHSAWNILSARRRQAAQDLFPIQVDHPAVQLALARSRDGSLPLRRTDGYKLGLVVEGGGMRGAVSAGSLLALDQLGLRDSFDAVYGASAGAINATYFLTGQPEGVSIYSEDIANKQFCDLSRLVGPSKEPVLNLGFLIDYVMEEVKPLRWDDVISSPIPLKVVASCLDQLRPVVLENFTDKLDLAFCLKASANIPVIAGQPLTHRGRRLVDGAVFEAVPFRQAIADGCTHVIVLCTRPPFKGGRLQKAINEAVEAGIKRSIMSPSYMREAWRAEMGMLGPGKLSNSEMLVLAMEEGASELPWFQGCLVYPVFPGAASNYPPVCIDPPTIRAGVEAGRFAVMRTFDSLGLSLIGAAAVSPEKDAEELAAASLGRAEL